jgi:hypothetical protein
VGSVFPSYGARRENGMTMPRFSLRTLIVVMLLGGVIAAADWFILTAFRDRLVFIASAWVLMFVLAFSWSRLRLTQ